jgi:hypothetical protein
MDMPDPVTLEDVTYVFEPGRNCYNATYGWTSHCASAPKAKWWTHDHDRRKVDFFYFDRMDEPVTIRIRVCSCRACGHGLLDRDEFMESPEIANQLQSRRNRKVEVQKWADDRAWEAACLAACEGVPIKSLTPGLLKRLLEVQ